MSIPPIDDSNDSGTPGGVPSAGQSQDADQKRAIDEVCEQAIGNTDPTKQQSMPPVRVQRTPLDYLLRKRVFIESRMNPVIGDAAVHRLEDLERDNAPFEVYRAFAQSFPTKSLCQKDQLALRGIQYRDPALWGVDEQRGVDISSVRVVPETVIDFQPIKISEIDSQVILCRARFQTRGREPIVAHFHLAKVSPQTVVSPYLPSTSGLIAGAGRATWEAKVKDLDLADSRELAAFKLDMSQVASGLNCYAFAASYLADKTITPGSLQRARVTSRSPAVEPWMCDEHLKEQGCLRISDMIFDLPGELCEFQQKRPVYLAAFIYGNDDVHVMRAFFNEGTGQVNWLQAGGRREVTFVKKGGELLTGIPTNVSDFLVDGVWDKWLGYYLIPTENLRVGSVPKLYDCEGNPARFKHNPEPK